MRIAVVHSYYSSGAPSGENAIVDLSTQILREAGHEVGLFDRRTDAQRDSLLYTFRSGMRVATGLGASPSPVLREFAPDIVHVHNLFPNFGTRWLAEWRQRLITTIHNFRPVCANGLLFRDGVVCMACPNGSSIEAVKHSCYKDSRIATLPLAVRNLGGLPHDAIFSLSSRIITLSAAAKDMFERFGGSSERMVVLPNGVPSTQQVASGEGNGRWLTVGRLTVEKGISQLVGQWPATLELDIVGEGPLRDEISAKLTPGTRLVGSLNRTELLERMSQYEGLVFPSVCLEMQPTVVIEAMSVGLPVVALKGNAGADLVVRFGAGEVYSGPEDLERCLESARLSHEAFGAAGRHAYEQFYTPERWLASIEGLYADVAQSAERNGSS